jgi:hypothetical protein
MSFNVADSLIFKCFFKCFFKSQTFFKVFVCSASRMIYSVPGSAILKFIFSPDIIYGS